MSLSKRDLVHVFERLRSGAVPERGLDTFAVGIERERAEVARQLDYVKDQEGTVKFLRGGYGCGKTFLARLAVADAQARGFATSFVVVSDNDLHFHRFDDVYRKVVGELSTSASPRGALADVLDRWVARVEEHLIALGRNPDAPGFDEEVLKKLDEHLASQTKNEVPPDFVRVVRKIFELKQAGQLSDATALLSWLSGSENVSAATKKLAGIKGEIQSTDALHYLRGILAIVKGAGYHGLVIVIDEAETILRMKSDVRAKSLNGMRQIVDAAGGFPGLLWLFTGTPEFFDTNRGVKGLQPLHDRVQFRSEGGFSTLRQPQLQLKPFDAARLKEVALKLRELFPAKNRADFEQRVTPAYLTSLVDEVTRGFAGDVGVVPRQFLRRVVSVFDVVDDEPDFVPREGQPEVVPALRIEEQAVKAGQPLYREEPGDERGYEVMDV
jgi:hypothetical protein